jgi:hypothetical protein
VSKHWLGLPYLDVLRPEVGWRVERAILATYSADLVAVVAALLALAGLDDDRGSGSKVDFANAYEQLRDRVRILVQAGQIAQPHKRIPILSILDRFLTEINPDDTGGIWHPKVALVKLQSDKEEMIVENPNAVVWRLWLGSRNLTRSLDWDAGLVLISSENGQQIPGIAELGTELTRRAGLPHFDSEQIGRELAQVRWQCPAGIVPDEIRLLTPKSQRGLPSPPKYIEKLYVVSPFLDGKTVAKLGSWGEYYTERWLLSTQSELARLHVQASQPLARFKQLLTLAAPELNDTVLASANEQNLPENNSEDEEIEARGLHAKLILAKREQGHILWLGSANATSAGWAGPNTEVVARLNILDKKVADGLLEFMSMAHLVEPSTLPVVVEPDPEEKLLTEAHRQVVARWQIIQQRHPDGPQLVCEHLPHPDEPKIRLEVGLLACDLVAWPHQHSKLQLPPITLAQETELVQVRLTLGERQCTWLQCAPLDPPPDEERDRRALARHLDPRTFLLWLRSLLNAGDIGDGGGDWATPPARSTRQHPGSTSPTWLMPTLEELLRAWSRNPMSLQIIDGKIEHYFKLIQEYPGLEYSQEEKQLLEEFQQTWKLLRQVLVSEQI